MFRVIAVRQIRKNHRRHINPFERERRKVPAGWRLYRLLRSVANRIPERPGSTEKGE